MGPLSVPHSLLQYLAGRIRDLGANAQHKSDSSAWKRSNTRGCEPLWDAVDTPPQTSTHLDSYDEDPIEDDALQSTGLWVPKGRCPRCATVCRTFGCRKCLIVRQLWQPLNRLSRRMRLHRKISIETGSTSTGESDTIRYFPADRASAGAVDKEPPVLCRSHTF